MGVGQFVYKTLPDNNRVSIELHVDGAPLGHVILDAAALEEHAQAIAKHRKQITPEVAPDLPADPSFDGAVVDPVWRTFQSHTHEAESLVLALRHPGLGWLWFLLPHNEAATLGKWLVSHAKQH